MIGTTFGRQGTEHTEFGAVAFDSDGSLDRCFSARGVCRARASGGRRADGVAEVGSRAIALGQQYAGEKWLLECSLGSWGSTFTARH
jgi:hypothetical protein